MQYSREPARTIEVSKTPGFVNYLIIGILIAAALAYGTWQILVHRTTKNTAKPVEHSHADDVRRERIGFLAKVQERIIQLLNENAQKQGQVQQELRRITDGTRPLAAGESETDYAPAIEAAFIPKSDGDAMREKIREVMTLLQQEQNQLRKRQADVRTEQETLLRGSN